MEAAAKLCEKLTCRQQQQQQQQQRQSKGQQADQEQAELNNSFNHLALAALRLWLLLCDTLTTVPADTASSAASGSSSTTAAAAAAVPSAEYASPGKDYAQVAKFCVHAMQHWPAPSTADAAISGAASSSSSSTSSTGATVRYGKVTLQQLPVADAAAALPAVLAAAQTISAGIAAVDHYSRMTKQQLVQLGKQLDEDKPEQLEKSLKESRVALFTPAVFELLLLLLACQAKVHYVLAAPQLQQQQQQQLLSVVCKLTLQRLAQPPPSQQQQQGQDTEQQQQQQQGHGPEQRLQVPTAHNQVLIRYNLKARDIALLQQQQLLPGMKSIRCVLHSLQQTTCAAVLGCVLCMHVLLACGLSGVDI
jgi:hypothetical protein